MPEHHTAKSKSDGLVGITGTPGTGKKSIAPLTAAVLDLRCFSINDLARGYGLLENISGNAEVDVRKLKSKLSRGLDGPALVYGHLLPDVFESDSMARVIVLRCEPSILKNRLESRRYSKRRLIANVEAELIGLISSEAFGTFGERRTVEIDTSKTSPAEAAQTVVEAIKTSSAQSKRIDWTLSYGSARRLKSLLSMGTG
jgi:adenylate kinase